jgi:hypothetical protein
MIQIKGTYPEPEEGISADYTDYADFALEFATPSEK